MTPYEEKMQKTIDSLATDYSAIRAGRANPHILDKIKVDYYGLYTLRKIVNSVIIISVSLICFILEIA